MPATVHQSLLRISIASALLVPLPSCGLFKAVADAPGAVAGAVTPGRTADKLKSLDTLHPRLLSVADSCSARTRLATDAFAEEAGTRAATIQALRWRLSFTRAMYQAATGPSPLTGLLDTLVLVTTGKVLFQTRHIADKWGAPARHIASALQSMEILCWEVSADYLTKAQVEELKATLKEWEDRKLGSTSDEFEELPDFRQLAHALGKKDTASSGGLMNFLSIDPLAGLEPVAREVALSRQFMERVMFWVERQPSLIEDQVELATLSAQQLPEVATTIASLERVSKVTESLAATADRLPKDLEREREAAVTQIGAEVGKQADAAIAKLSDEVSRQRSELLADLDKASAPVNSVLAESRTTIAAGQAMSAELTKTVQALDTLMARFEPAEEEKPAAAQPAAAAPAEPGKPFDIVEYGEAATRIGTAAAELGTAIRTLDQSMPNVQKTIDAAVSRIDQSIESAYQKGLQMGLVLVGAGAIAVLLVRRLGARSRQSVQPPVS
ncbi:MAG: hypothetical protein RL148_831 [Planctomycetota bacterium]